MNEITPNQPFRPPEDDGLYSEELENEEPASEMPVAMPGETDKLYVPYANVAADEETGEPGAPAAEVPLPPAAQKAQQVFQAPLELAADHLINVSGAGTFKITYKVRQVAFPFLQQNADFVALAVNKGNINVMEERHRREVNNEHNIHQFLRTLDKATISHILAAKEVIYFHSGKQGIIMEWCNGGNLEHYLKKTLTLEQKYFIAAQMAKAVSQLHAAGIVHRDVKPDNFMVKLDKDGNLEQIKLGDLSLSSFIEPGKRYSPHKILKGYSPPEINESEALFSPSTDVHQLGMSFYQLFTGANMNQIAALEKVAPEQLPNFNLIPKPARNMIKKMLDIDPAKRPTANEVSQFFAQLALEQ